MLAMSAAHVGDVRRDRRTGNGLGRRHSNAGRTIGGGPVMDAGDPVRGAPPQDPDSFVERVHGRCDVHAVG